MSQGLKQFIDAYDNLSRDIKDKNFVSTKNITLEQLIGKQINPDLINNTILQYYKNVQYDDITEFINVIKNIDTNNTQEVPEPSVTTQEQPISNVDENNEKLVNQFKLDNKIDKMLTSPIVRKRIDLYKKYLDEKIDSYSNDEEKNILRIEFHKLLENNRE